MLHYLHNYQRKQIRMNAYTAKTWLVFAKARGVKVLGGDETNNAGHATVVFGVGSRSATCLLAYPMHMWSPARWFRS
ncbi:hypothetical protein BJB45_01980 [Halomonas huangheensis]|uniref:Uncharacterized protein n=1 Tax=Halomonas huangheensis TaxID=1178482 RepID=W1N4R4_9GAMM|nr:hypothetical protein AR456_03490 [Halomonas huangheensis]ERL49915.1 hypothetical protein BJB45_01980 [Halomonas huangheensis]